MKTKISIFFQRLAVMLMVIAMLPISCDEDLLDTTNKNKVPEEELFRTLEGAESVLLGAYNRFNAYDLIALNTVLSDEVKYSISNNGGDLPIAHRWDHNSSIGYFNNLWFGAYISISLTNKVLYYLPNIPAVTEEDVLLKTKLEAEARAFRAYCHYILVTSFSKQFEPNNLGIPYVTIFDEKALPPRPTMQETYNNIITDAKTALDLYETLPNPEISDNIRMNIYSTKALLSSAYLDVHKYSESVAIGSELLEVFSLASDDVSFNTIWEDADNTEVIFQLAKTQGQDNIGRIWNRTATLFEWYASDDLVNQYQAEDIRINAYFAVARDNKGSMQQAKYLGTPSIYGLNNIKLFRISEIYLIVAEAKAKLGNLAGAHEYLEALRQARNAGVTPNFTSMDDALSKVLEERRRELAFEGKRFIDLKKAGYYYIERIESDCIEAVTTLCVLQDKNKFVFPIPKEEIMVNKNIAQNTGY